MGEQQEAHLASILSETDRLLDAKYRAGQEEHGGYLASKPQAANLVEEALDQGVYAVTLRDQHRELVSLAKSGSDDELRAAVMRYCA